MITVPRSVHILCLILMMAAAAAAQSVHAQAEALFRRGKQLIEQNKLAEACAAFERSQQLEPDISTLLNLADCRERNSQLATAWQLFTETERQTHAQSDEISKRLNWVATGRAGQLLPRLSKLSIDVAPDSLIEGLEILRDAVPVAPAAWGHQMPIDGGTHKITARAPGYAPWTMTVIMKPEGDIQVAAVPKLESLTITEPKPDIASSAPDAGVTPPRERELPSGVPPNPNNPLLSPGDPILRRPETPPRAAGVKRSLARPLVLGGASLILGGTAYGFLRWGDSIYSEAKREPDDAKRNALWKSANTRRYAAQGFVLGAAGCIGAAIYFYIRSGREATRPAANRSIRIDASASAMGLSLSGNW